MASCPRCKRIYPEGTTACPEDGEVLIPESILASASDQEIPRGSTVGEYVIEGKLGSGTFGHVYRAVQPLIAKQVAIKVLSRKYSADPDIVSRFIAEARAVNQIRHRNIIDIFSFGQLPDGRHYHIMELLSGGTLDQHLKDRGRLPIVEAILILRPLAKALDAAHACGIAHRDLKPANVFLSRDDDGKPFPKLLDFGIAKLMTDQMPRQHQTATGAAVGTPDYMSPEQCQGPDIDHRTDIYAFGVMTYQLVTGKLPFSGKNVVEVLVKQMTAEAVPPSHVFRDLPPAIDAPILWMLAKEKTSRPPDLATAVNALEVALNASGITVPRTSTTGDPTLTATPRSVPPELMVSAETGNAATRPSFPGAAALADPALSATLPSDARAIAPGGTDARGSRGWIFAGAAAVAIALGIAAALFTTREHEDAANAATHAPVAPVEVPAQPVQVVEPAARVEQPPAEPPTIQLQVRTEQRGIEVLGPGGVVLGRAPVTLTLPRGTEKLELQFRAPGFVSETRSITPLADGEVDVKLARAIKAPPKKNKEKKAKKAGADDLESFE